MTGKEFDTQFRRMYLPLGMYALRIVGDAALAEDLVSEAFMKAWRKVMAGDDIGNFQAFMYRCVRNACVSFLRSVKETENIEDTPEISEDAVDTSLRDARIWTAIESLPEKCREIFLLSKRDGLSNEEIADELGISIKTVKNQMTKAFSRLRDALTDNGKPFFLPFL